MTLDLNGFSLIGVPDAGHGIETVGLDPPSVPQRYNITVKNGIILGYHGFNSSSVCNNATARILCAMSNE